MRSTTATARAPRWDVIRDVAGFQVKLGLDALRDVLLSPISLIAAVAGLIFQQDRPGRLFYGLLRYGQVTERWINLFGAAGRFDSQPPGVEPEDLEEIGSVDDLLQHVERAVVEQYERGGVTATAKDQIDRLLDSLQPEDPRGGRERIPSGKEPPSAD